MVKKGDLPGLPHPLPVLSLVINSVVHIIYL